MPSTHLSLHYHLIFSTKNRYPFIDREWRDRLHAYLGGCLNTLGGIPESIGGTEDHVHILAGLKSTHRLADVLRDIKQPSSEWIHDTVKAGKFAWQEGYGAFTVSASNREAISLATLRRPAGAHGLWRACLRTGGRASLATG